MGIVTPVIKLDLEPCVPPVWAPPGHPQTVLGHLLPSKMLKSPGRRIEFALPDGDRLVGFLTEGKSKTLVYLFHGLGGSTDATYMHRTARVALAQGHSVFMVNHRNCGAGQRLARGPYHSGRGEDIGSAIAEGRKMFPHYQHLAIGFSLSANALLLLLSGKRGNVFPDAAITVNAPIDLQKCSNLLGMGFNKVYDVRFYRQCRRDVLKYRAEGAKPYEIPWLRTLQEFDDLYTAPAGGFKDRRDYYAQCSTANLLNEIKTPTFVLTAADDPFVDVEAYRRAKPSANVSLHIENFGGHMGYLTKTSTPLGTFRWQDYAIDRAINAFVSN